MSLRRQNPWMLNNLTARILFWSGMAILPAYLLQTSLFVRLIQVVFFGWLTTVAGKRLQWVYFLSIIATITVFHVLVPSGLVIASIGGFRITLGALRIGLFKALTIVGMVFISLTAVRADLRLPGRLGTLAGKMFWSFEQIMENRSSMEVRRPFVSGDQLLLGLYDRLAAMDEEHARTGERKATAARSSRTGRILACVTVLMQWLLVAIPVPF